MSRTKRQIPSEINLARNLAGRLKQLREYRNMTELDLSRATRLSRQRIEDLEAGVETWLSASDRQVLSRALNIEPAVLLESELRPASGAHPVYAEQERFVLSELGESILAGSRDLVCPACGSALRCSVQKGFDIQGRPSCLPKAFCQKCPFILK
ncbi:MAG: helix-turn-helix domain-containing protein [Candidatus Obscuribacterales bacterium]